MIKFTLKHFNNVIVILLLTFGGLFLNGNIYAQSVARSCDDDPIVLTSADFIGTNATVESEAGSPTVVEVGDVFRFNDVSAGIDCLVSVDAFINGASINSIDNLDATTGAIGGFDRAFQPVIEGDPGVNGQEVVFTFNFVVANTNISQAVSVYLTALDLDSNIAGDVERVKLEIPDAYYTNGANSQINITQTPTQIIGESNGSGIVDGINVDDSYSFTGYYNSFSSIEYTISKDGYNGGLGFEDRQFSLLFEDVEYSPEESVLLTNPIICGQVFVDGAPRSGVAVNLTGDSTQTTTTDANGQYSFTVSGNGNFTITETDLSGTVSLSDVDAGNDNTIAIAITNFESSQENDFFDSILVSVGDVTVVEGDDGSTVVANFPVTLGAPVDVDTTVAFTVSNGTGTLGDADYVAPTVLTVVIPAGQTGGVFPVTVNGDDKVENNEQFSVSIASVSSGTINPAANTGVGTITNDDTAGVLSVSTEEELEGTSLVHDVVVAESIVAEVYPFVISNDSTEDADYTLPTDAEFTNGVVLNGDGTITVPAGVTDFTVTVPTTDDTIDEEAEVYDLTVGGVAATGTITDNDDAGVVSVSTEEELEGTSLVHDVVVVESADAEVYPFVISNDSTEDEDYTLPTDAEFTNGVVLNGDGTITVPAGVTDFTVTVPTTDDAIDEEAEVYDLTVGGVAATGTITDNDDAGVVSVSTEEELEGTSLVHDVVVVESADAEVYPFVISNDSTEDEDYTLPTDAEFTNGVVLNGDGTITVPAGVTDFTVTVPTTDDAIDEEAEVYDLTVGGVAATGTITDNDDAGVVSVSTEEELEGTSLVHDVVVVESADAEVYPFVISNDSTEDEDYTLPTDAEFTNGVVLNGDGTITVPAGVTDFTVTVPTTDDAIDEEAEVYDLTVGGVAATGTITDNDDAGVVSVSTEEELEGTSLVHDVVVVESADAEVYPFVISNDSTEDEDYTLPTDAEFTNGVVLNGDGTITVPAGVTDFTVTVPTTDDAIDEEAEVYDLTVGGVAATGTITDNDDAGVVSVSTEEELEGTSLVHDVVVVESADAEVYPFVISNDSTEDEDYTLPTDAEFTNGVVLNGDGTITVPAGVTDFTVTVPTTDDAIDEEAEVYDLTVGGVAATGTITDNDDAGVVSVSTEEELEGTSLVHDVVVVESADAEVYPFVISNDSTEDEDYTLPTDAEFTNGVVLNGDGTITVPAGVTDFTVTVPTTDDTIDEEAEVYDLTVGGVAATGTITDNDDAGVVSVSTEEELEGTSLVHDVVVVESADAEVYPFVISNDSTEDEDYTLPTDAEFTNGVVLNGDGTITVPAGVTDFTVTVPTTDDAIDEEAEVYDLTVGGVAATGTITDNDDAGVVSVSTEEELEGTSLVHDVVVVESADAEVYPFVISNDSTEDEDYTLPTDAEFTNGVVLNGDGTITVPAGVTDFTVTVPTTDDAIDEEAEVYDLTVGGVAATGTITDNDDAGVVSVSTEEELEGTSLVHDVVVVESADAEVYPFVISNDSTEDEDYTLPTDAEFTNGVVLNGDGTITVPAGVTDFTVTVPTTDDAIDEEAEVYDLTVGGVAATGTITDNDDAGVVSVSTEEELEGTSLVHDVVVVESADAEVYPFVISNDSTEDEDYTLPTDAEFTNGVVLNGDGTITVPAGVTDFTVTVPTTDDAIDEEAEVYDLTVGGVAATGTITDNDDAGVVSVSTEEELEGTSLVHDVVVVESADAEVYPFVISNDSTEDEDYTLPTDAEFTNGVVLNGDGTITVPAGVTDFTVTVPTTDDAIDEEAEVYDLTVGGVAATGTITDNDDAGVVSVSTEEELEGTSLVHDVVVVESADAEVYPFVISNDSTEDEDYTLPTDAEFTNGVVLNGDGTITVPAGVTDFTVTVPTTDDAIDEEAEVYDLTVGGVAATGTITDNDDAGVVSVSTEEELEGTSLVHDVVVVESADAEVYPFVISNDSTEDEDYTLPTDAEFTNGVVLNGDGTITVPAGVTDFTVTVPTTDDAIDEEAEVYDLTVGGVAATGTITDNDDAGVVSVSTEEELEGTSLVHDVVVVESADAEVYPFVISNDSTEDEDYTLPTDAEFTNGVVLNGDGTITVPAGVTDFTVTVPTTDDAIDEEAEVYDLTVGGVAATGTITDNDDAGVVSVSTEEELEGTSLVHDVVVVESADAEVYPFVISNDSTEDEDYTLPTDAEFTNGVVLNGDGTITVPAGVTDFTVTVPTTDDAIDEEAEVYDLTVGGVAATGTITDNDDAGVVSVSTEEELEGTSLVHDVVVVESADAEVYPFVISNDSTEDEDYTLPTDAEFTNGVVLNGDGTITVPAGVTDFTVTVPTTDDAIDEEAEVYDLTVGGVAATGTITDNDDAGVVSVSTEEELEGTSLVHDVVVVESADAEVYPFVISNDSTEDEDYTLPTDAEFTNGVVLNGDGTITVPAGVTDFTVTVPTTDDAIDEEAEVYDLTVGGVAATGTITDNDDAGVVSVSTEEELEGTSLVHDVVVVESADAEVYPFVISNDSTEDEDYTLPTDAEFTNGVVLNGDGTITVPAGVTDFTVTVPTTDDAIDEEAEVYDLTVGGVAATGTITDNDDAGVVSVSTEEELEGTSLVHDVVVVESADAEVYPFVISNDSTEDEDYTLPTDAEFTNGVVLNGDGTITVPAGVTDFTVTVPTTDDAIDEEAEVYDLTVGGVAATGTITDNDDAGVVSVSTEEELEGTSLVHDVVVVESADAEVYPFVISNDSTEDEDYTLPTDAEFTNGVVLNGDGTITVPAGVTDFTVTVPTTDDAIDEEAEVYDLTVGGVAATGTITDNDDAPTVTIEDVVVNEDAGTVTVPVTLTNPSDEDTVIEIVTTTGTAGEDDFEETIVTVTIPAGETEGEVVVPITEDTTDEEDEIFTVDGTVTSGNTDNTDPSGTVTIIDNDDAPTVTIEDVVVNEDAGTVTVPVTLTNPSDEDTVIEIVTTTGTAGEDDFEETIVTVTIPAGETEGEVVVPITEDTTDEEDEIFTVDGTVTSGNTANTDPSGDVTITDNDDAPTVTIEDVVVNEDAGTVTVPVTLSNPSDEDTVIDIVTTTGTAGEDDFEETIVTVTIPAGETEGEVIVPITEDTTDEEDEIFTVDGTVTSGNTDNTDPSGTVTITDNDDAPTVTIEDVVVNEDAGIVTVPVTLSNPSDEDTVIDIVTTTGTAGEDDFEETIVTVTIPAGETEGEVVVPITEDTTDEEDEIFTVDGTVTSGNTANTDPSGTVTITDNDDAPTVTIEDVVVNEDAGIVTVPVTLSNPSDEDTVIDIVTTTGTAGEDDFEETIVTVTIPAGETEGEVVVPITEDTTDEEDEIFTVDGTVTSGNTDNTDPSGTVTIVDNDDAPTVTIEDVVVNEDAGTATVPVTLSNPSDEDTVIDIVTTTGTAGEDDYTETIVTVTIPAGETEGEVVVPITEDTTDEEDEIFTVDGTVTSGNTANTDPSGDVTITDNDDAPTVTIEDVVVNEDAGTVTVPVTLSNPSDEDTVIDIVTTTGTAGEDDFEETIVTVTIPAGETEGEVVVPITEDTTDEEDEIFTVDGTVTSGNTANTDPSGDVTITDNDGAPTVTIGDVVVNEDAGTVTVPVTLSNPSDEDTVIDIVTTTGTAGEDDFEETIVTVTIPAGETEGEVVVPITEDTTDEEDEIFTVDGTVTSGNTDNTDPSGTVTIVDNDDAPTVTIEDVVVNEDAGTVTIPVTLSNPSDEDTVIDIVTTTGTAGEDDFEETIVTVTIPAGETEGEVIVPITEDTTDEEDEIFTVDGTVTSGNTANTDPSGTVTIIDNDDAPTVTIEDVVVNEDAGTVTVPVTLTNPSDEDTVIEIVTTTGTAGEDDFEETIVTVTIPAGETEGEVVVPITEDTTDEEDEIFTVDGTVTSGNTANTDPSGDVTITDNDDAPTVTIEDVVVNEDAGTVTVPVTLSNPSDEDTVIDIVTTTGTAGEDDFEETIVTVTIPAGETEGEVIVPITEDTTDEEDEIFTVDGTVTSGNTDNTDPSGTVTITDNDDAPTVTIEDVVVNEDAGIVTVPVMLSNPSDEDTVIDIVTTTGTAGEDDFEETIVTVTIPAGETEGEVVVPITEDTTDEEDEIFTVDGTVTSGNTDNTDPSGTVTITDNDDAPTVTIEDVVVNEDAGIVTVPVTLSNPSDEDTVIDIVTTTGTAGEDDFEETIVTVTIPAGETEGEVVVPITEDTTDEEDEIFTVDGTVTSGNTDNTDPSGTVTIVDNDDAPTVTIEDVVVNEDAGTATVPVTLSNPSDEDTVIDIVTTTGTAGEDDYTETIVTVTIPAGETEGEVVVPITEDTTDEEDEIFTVDGTVTSGNTANTDPSGDVTITDNDDAPTVTIEDVVVNEDAGTVTVPVTLSNPSDEDTVIDIVTTTGTAGEDDFEETIVTVTIPAGETEGEVVVPITEDTTDEEDEIFTVDGTVTSGNTDNTDPSGTVTITDNDGAPTVTIGDVVVNEDAGTVTVPVTLSNPSDEDTVIDIVTTTGTAGEDDFEETIVTVTIPAGETEGEVVVPITEDTTDEEDEIFTVDGTVTSGNTDNTDPSGTVTIVDNDDAPTVTIEDVVVNEDAGTVTIPVTLSNPSDEDTVIEIVTTTGTAGEDDYTETIVTVTIPAGETTGEVVIPITDDMLDEEDEIFTVDGTVTSGNTANTDPSGDVTITDNDGAPTVTIEDVIVDEGAGTVTIPVTLSNPSDEDTVIEIVTTTGTAGDDDYIETIVTVTIPAGETTGEVVIPITDDTLDEDDEIFTVDGTVTSGNTDNTDPSGTVTITDNDGAPTVTIEDVIVDEGAGTVTIPVTLSNPSDEDTVIEIVTTTGTAGEDDYTETIVTVTIPAGETTGEVVIPITDDMLDEEDETFTVDGTVTSGNTANTDPSGDVTITDNDGAPTVTIEDVVVDEDAGTVTIPVTLSNPSDEDTVIEIVTTTGTAGEDDYTETIVTVTIPAGETTGEVVIPITDDMLDEEDEIFTVDGTVTSGNTDNTDPSGTVTIVDNDDAPTVTIEDVVVNEDAGTVTIPVTLSNPSDEDTVIEIVTTTGTAGEDDFEETIVTVTIPAGETTGEVVIPITDDMLDEEDETFTVDGTVTSGNTANTDPSGTVTITDNDGAPTVTIEDVVVDEGAGTVTIPVTLSNPSDEDTVIEIVTTTGTAGEDDYTETIVTVTIPAGETTGEVVIPITDDMLDEEDETFTVDGTVTSGNTDNTDPSGTVTITDNDAPVTTPNLDLVKVGIVNDSNGNDVVDAGDTITYTLTVTNNGNEDLTNVIVVDPLIIINEGPVAVLAISESATFTGTYTITQDDIEAGGVVNVATAEGTDQAGNTITDQSDDPTDTTNVDVDGDGDFEDPTVTILDQSPDIMITKNGVFQDFNQDGFANAGDQILYTFDVINTGNVILNDVIVTDEMVEVIGDAVSLLPGESVTFTAVYIITQQDVTNGEVVNTALAIGLTNNGLEISDISDDVTDTTGDDDPTVTVLSQSSGLIFNNGISMNGDGRNDSFRIQGIENFPENRLRIFNRWGVEVYNAEGYGSDGKAFIGLSEGRTTISQDKFLPVGTYYWILEYVNSVGETINNSGYLYLTR